MDNDITLKAITSLKDFQSLEHFWTSLLNKRPYSYFQFSFEWLYTWTQHVSPNGGFLILSFWKAGELVGIIPMSIITHKAYRLVPYRTLTFLSHNYCDHSDLLIAGHETQIMEAFLDFLVANKTEWERVILKNIPEHSPTLSLFPQILEQKKFTYKQSDYKRFYFIDLKSRAFADYYATDTSKKFVRRDLNRIRNMFNREGGYALEHFSADNDAGELNNLFNAIAFMHSDRQSELDRSSMYDNPALQRFIRAIYQIYHNQHKLDITLLKFKDQYISYAVGFIADNIFYWWNTGFDTSYSKYAPTKLLLYHLIESCFERGFSRFSFMRGESEYKEKWTKTYFKTYDIVITNTHNLKSRLIHKFK